MGITRIKLAVGRPRKSEAFTDVRSHFIAGRGHAEIETYPGMCGGYRWRVVLPEKDQKTGKHITIDCQYPEMTGELARMMAARAAETWSSDQC